MRLFVVALAVPIFAVVILWFTAWVEHRVLDEPPAEPETGPLPARPLA